MFEWLLSGFSLLFIGVNRVHLISNSFWYKLCCIFLLFNCFYSCFNDFIFNHVNIYALFFLFMFTYCCGLHCFSINKYKKYMCVCACVNICLKHHCPGSALEMPCQATSLIQSLAIFLRWRVGGECVCGGEHLLMEEGFHCAPHSPFGYSLSFCLFSLLFYQLFPTFHRLHPGQCVGLWHDLLAQWPPYQSNGPATPLLL